MKTVSLQTMPNGFEVELPTFGYWFKAGAAFTMGAILMTFLAGIAYLSLWFVGLVTILSRLGH